MRTSTFVMVLVGFLSVFAATSCTKDGGSPDERGRDLLRSLAPLAVGEADTAYFKAVLAGDVCGGAALSLTPFTDQDRLLYEYQYSLALRINRESVFERSLRIILDPTFSPIEVVNEQATIDAQGPRDHTWLTASLGPETVQIRTQENGEERSEELPIPERPFVAGVSFILQLGRPPTESSFSLPLFRASDATIERVLLQPVGESGSATRFEQLDEAGKPVGHYRLDEDGTLESFREAGATWTMERSTREEFLLLLDSLKRGLAVAAQADSQGAPERRP
jgi:hypothetical protein